jgi:hypothetical protein
VGPTFGGFGRACCFFSFSFFYATIKGIEINRAIIKISQFADDTQIFAETYEDITKALRWVAIYGRATGSKVNGQRSQVCGNQMGHSQK